MTEDVPGYRVLEQVGEGGFSVVYRALQERLDRMVALKVMSIGTVDNAAMRRFQRECKITGRLSGHPNVVTVLDTGTTRANRPFIAMEYFEQGALADRLDREGPFPVGEVLRIGVKMAGALAATHETDVLHRDVKPQNILVSRYGEPALADFGIARLVDTFDATHTQAFTPHHAAPEVLEGRPAGVGTDLYSLGSTLYQLLAGRPAFKGPQGEGIALLMLRILNDAPPPFPRTDVPLPVFEAITRAMAKAPEHRYADAVEFAQRLQRLQRELGLPITDLAHSGGDPAARQATGPHAGGGTATGAGPWTTGDRSATHDGPRPPAVPDWAPTVQGALPSTTPRPAPSMPDPSLGNAPGLSPWPPGTDPQAQPQRSHGSTAPQNTSGGGLAPSWPPQQDQPNPQGPVGGGAPVHDGPRRGLIVAAAVALVGGVSLGIGALALSGGGKDPEDGKTASPTAPAGGTAQGGAAQGRSGPIPAAQVAAARPRKVTARPVGTQAALIWTLPQPARALPLIVQQLPRGRTEFVTVQPGSRSATVPGLNPKVRYCFQVGAVLRLNPGKPADIAWSSRACTRPAKAGR
ncbi:serine/threonine-protein kinase [Spirillospora sp. NBC_01491]|uniref:serine/threonine-protein kinase n=1 Tax=Spirillospora sp. NBC_01491 TaxID=2976007 RepID=UPI002E3771B2|nr:protein kinase [Spirillospora sp. NBC_01491]